jgi:urease accessory protein
MWLSPALPRARSVLPAGSWLAVRAGDSITLDFDARHRRRMRMTSDGGVAFLLDLAETRLLQEGDGLVCDSGLTIAVRAAEESLLEVRCADATELARIAYHLGNRHLSVQVLPNLLRIRDDHVIATMLRQMGARVTAVKAPFTPEGGAYAHSQEHSHA